MKEFHFEYYHVVPVQKRTFFSIEAETMEEAVKQLEGIGVDDIIDKWGIDDWEDAGDILEESLYVTDPEDPDIAGEVWYKDYREVNPRGYSGGIIEGDLDPQLWA